MHSSLVQKIVAFPTMIMSFLTNVTIHTDHSAEHICIPVIGTLYALCHS